MNKVAAEEGDEQELEEEEVKEETWEDKDIKTEDEAPKTGKKQNNFYMLRHAFLFLCRTFVLLFSSVQFFPLFDVQAIAHSVIITIQLLKFFTRELDR